MSEILSEGCRKTILKENNNFLIYIKNNAQTISLVFILLECILQTIKGFHSRKSHLILKLPILAMKRGIYGGFS